MKKMFKNFGIITIIVIIGLVVAACKEPEPSCSHEYGDWSTKTEATCVAAKVEKSVCSLCENENTRNVGEPLGHDYVSSLICKRTGCDHQYALGDTGPGGGIIFYIADGEDSRSLGFTLYMDVNDSIGTTAYYLEAAPSDTDTHLLWNSPACTPVEHDGTADEWLVTTGTGTAIGTGKKNTALILAGDPDAPAAKACNNFSNNEKNDWFFPSRDELYELYNQKSILNMTKDKYWSSSETEWPGVAWGCIFLKFWDDDVLGLYTGFKAGSLWIRAIRAF